VLSQATNTIIEDIKARTGSFFSSIVKKIHFAPLNLIYGTVVEVAVVVGAGV
jgi:hypothetical protein